MNSIVPVHCDDTCTNALLLDATVARLSDFLETERHALQSVLRVAQSDPLLAMVDRLELQLFLAEVDPDQIQTYLVEALRLLDILMVTVAAVVPACFEQPNAMPNEIREGVKWCASRLSDIITTLEYALYE